MDTRTANVHATPRETPDGRRFPCGAPASGAWSPTKNAVSCAGCLATLGIKIEREASKTAVRLSLRIDGVLMAEATIFQPVGGDPTSSISLGSDRSEISPYTARMFGRGLLDLAERANVELHFFTKEVAAAAA